MVRWHPWTGIWIGTAAVCLVLAAPEPADAGAPDRVSIFLRSNHIHLRIPDGPEYQAEVNSPVYETYAKEHATECARPPIIAGRDEVGVYYKTSQGPQTGVVRFEVLVDPTGHVVAFQVLESPGGYALYSVIKSVRDWTFVPGETEGGKATYCRYQYGFRFVAANG
jgi:hypothetical protein